MNIPISDQLRSLKTLLVPVLSGRDGQPECIFALQMIDYFPALDCVLYLCLLISKYLNTDSILAIILDLGSILMKKQTAFLLFSWCLFNERGVRKFVNQYLWLQKDLKDLQMLNVVETIKVGK